MKSRRFWARYAACLASALAGSTSLFAAPITKSATGTDLTLGASWGGTAPGAGDVATWTATSLGAGLTAATDVTWGSVNITGATANIAISGAGILNTGNVILAGNRTLTIANPVALTGASTHTIANVTNSTAADATFSGPVSGGFTLTKEGPGTEILSNISNSYAGGTIINAGELQPSIGTPAAGPVTTLGEGQVTVNSGATLRLMAGSTLNQYIYSNPIVLNNATLAYQDGNHVLTGGMALTGSNILTGVWATKNLTISGAIVGTGSLNKTITPGQDAVLVLQAANTYSGGTTVTGGTLNLDFSAATAPESNILSATAPVTLAGGNLTFNGQESVANTQTFSGLTLAPGTASILTVNPSFSGALEVNLGPLSKPGIAALNIISSGTLLTPTGTASTILTDSNTGAPYATVGGSDWAAKDAANTSIVGLSTLAGGYTPFETGTVTLTGNADLVPFEAGTFTLLEASNPGTIRNISVTGNTLALGGFPLTTRGILSNVTFTISGAGSLQPATAGGDLVLNQSANTTTVSADIADNATASSVIKTGAGTYAVSGVKSYTGTTHVLQGTFQMGSAPNLSGTATLATSGIHVATGATFNLGNGTLGAAQNITGPGNFTKGGNFITNGTINGSNNNYTGATAVTVGTLTLAPGAGINGTSGITISAINRAVIANNGSIATPGALTISGGNAENAGFFTNGNSGGTTPGTLSAGSLNLNTANGQTTGIAHGGAFTNNLNSTAAFSGTITVNGEGSATGGILASPLGSLFTNAGGTVTAATLTLNNSPVTNTTSNKGGTYTQTDGSTTLTTLNLVAANSTLPGAVGNDTALNLSGGVYNVTNASLNGITSVSGAGILNVSGQFYMGDTAATRSGNVTQSGGTVNLTTTTASALRIGHWATETSTYGLSGGTLNATGANLIVGYDGSGILEISDLGTANLRGIQINRGFGGSGTVNLIGGRLNLGTGGITFVAGTGAVSALNLGAGTMGAFGNWTSALAMSLTDSGDGTTFLTLDSVDGTTARTITLSGLLSGPGGLRKLGAGTLILSNAGNVFAGLTTVAGGTLLVNGNNNGGGGVTVASGGTLGGTGKITGSLQADGTISPGAFGIGTLTTSDAAVAGPWLCEINGTTTDRLDVQGALTLTGATLSVSPLGSGLTEESYVIATYTGSLTGVPAVSGAPGYVIDSTTPGQLRLVRAGQNSYDQWAATFPGFTGAAALSGMDFDNDGTANLLEFVLGGNPTVADVGILPQLEVTATDFVFTFQRADLSVEGGTLTFQFATQTDGTWTSVTVPPASATVGTASFTIAGNGAAPDSITVSIPRGTEARLFGRLKASRP